MTKMPCPHCGGLLSLKQLIELLHGDGYRKTVKAMLPDGRIVFLDAGTVNPREVEVLE